MVPRSANVRTYAPTRTWAAILAHRLATVEPYAAMMPRTVSDTTTPSSAAAPRGAPATEATMKTPTVRTARMVNAHASGIDVSRPMSTTRMDGRTVRRYVGLCRTASRRPSLGREVGRERLLDDRRGRPVLEGGPPAERA